MNDLALARYEPMPWQADVLVVKMYPAIRLPRYHAAHVPRSLRRLSVALASYEAHV
jgi:hypothetical protein